MKNPSYKFAIVQNEKVCTPFKNDIPSLLKLIESNLYPMRNLINTEVINYFGEIIFESDTLQGLSQIREEQPELFI